MPLYALYCIDRPDSLALRMANRPAHLEWIGGFRDRIAMAGPLFADDGETFAGSLVVIAADSVEAVRDWSAGDPYVRAGLFKRVDIRPFRWVIGEGPPAD